MILNLEQSQEQNAIEIRARMHDQEFEQLLGNLDELCVFACKTIKEPASVVQTGARHSYAKYLLFPVKLRRQFKTDEYDFSKLLCGALRSKDKLYVIYEVPRPGASRSAVENSPRADLGRLEAVEQGHRLKS